MLSKLNDNGDKPLLSFHGLQTLIGDIVLKREQPYPKPKGISMGKKEIRDFQQRMVSFLVNREKIGFLTGYVRGGALCADTGVGKTFAMAQLCAERLLNTSEIMASINQRGVKNYQAINLVVCPGLIKGHWVAELQAALPDVHVYDYEHDLAGDCFRRFVNKTECVEEKIRISAIPVNSFVLVAWKALETEYYRTTAIMAEQKQTRSITERQNLFGSENKDDCRPFCLASQHYGRIIFDEAQFCKPSKGSKTNQMCSQRLQSEFRWYQSATPVNPKYGCIMDLQRVSEFLQYDAEPLPFAWDKCTKDECQQLAQWLSQFMFCHTADQIHEQLSLPPIISKDAGIEFSFLEQTYYNLAFEHLNGKEAMSHSERKLQEREFCKRTNIRHPTMRVIVMEVLRLRLSQELHAQIHGSWFTTAMQLYFQSKTQEHKQAAVTSMEDALEIALGRHRIFGCISSNVLQNYLPFKDSFWNDVSLLLICTLLRWIEVEDQQHVQNANDNDDDNDDDIFVVCRRWTKQALETQLEKLGFQVETSQPLPEPSSLEDKYQENHKHLYEKYRDELPKGHLLRRTLAMAMSVCRRYAEQWASNVKLKDYQDAYYAIFQQHPDAKPLFHEKGCKCDNVLCAFRRVQYHVTPCICCDKCQFIKLHRDIDDLMLTPVRNAQNRNLQEKIHHTLNSLFTDLNKKCLWKEKHICYELLGLYDNEKKSVDYVETVKKLKSKKFRIKDGKRPTEQECKDQLLILERATQSRGLLSALDCLQNVVSWHEEVMQRKREKIELKKVQAEKSDKIQEIKSSINVFAATFVVANPDEDLVASLLSYTSELLSATKVKIQHFATMIDKLIVIPDIRCGFCKKFMAEIPIYFGCCQKIICLDCETKRLNTCPVCKLHPDDDSKQQPEQQPEQHANAKKQDRCMLCKQNLWRTETWNCCNTTWCEPCIQVNWDDICPFCNHQRFGREVSVRPKDGLLCFTMEDPKIPMEASKVLKKFIVGDQYHYHSSKIDYITQLISRLVDQPRLQANESLYGDFTVDTRKILVFDTDRDFLQQLRNDNYKRHHGSEAHLEYKCFYLPKRGMEVQAQQEIIENFQQSKKSAVLFLDLIESTGLHLPCADVVILCSPCNDVSVEKQAIARAHRPGQERPVSVYRCYMKNSIEQRNMETTRSPASKMVVTDVSNSSTSSGSLDHSSHVTSSSLAALLPFSDIKEQKEEESDILTDEVMERQEEEQEEGDPFEEDAITEEYDEGATEEQKESSLDNDSEKSEMCESDDSRSTQQDEEVFLLQNKTPQLPQQQIQQFEETIITTTTQKKKYTSLLIDEDYGNTKRQKVAETEESTSQSEIQLFLQQCGWEDCWENFDNKGIYDWENLVDVGKELAVLLGPKGRGRCYRIWDVLTDKGIRFAKPNDWRDVESYYQKNSHKKQKTVQDQNKSQIQLFLQQHGWDDCSEKFEQHGFYEWESLIYVGKELELLLNPKGRGRCCHVWDVLKKQGIPYAQPNSWPDDV